MNMRELACRAIEHVQLGRGDDEVYLTLDGLPAQIREYLDAYNWLCDDMDWTDGEHGFVVLSGSREDQP